MKSNIILLLCISVLLWWDCILTLYFHFFIVWAFSTISGFDSCFIFLSLYLLFGIDVSSFINSDLIDI